jgi:4-hydroxyphenylacetate 3-monooxygenase
VDDVTTHPAFRNAAQTLATIYDRKRAPENREVMTCEAFEADGPRTLIGRIATVGSE